MAYSVVGTEVVSSRCTTNHQNKYQFCQALLKLFNMLYKGWSETGHRSAKLSEEPLQTQQLIKGRQTFHRASIDNLSLNWSLLNLYFSVFELHNFLLLSDTASFWVWHVNTGRRVRVAGPDSEREWTRDPYGEHEYTLIWRLCQWKRQAVKTFRWKRLFHQVKQQWNTWMMGYTKGQTGTR